jgi:hypothetical protein
MHQRVVPDSLVSSRLEFMVLIATNQGNEVVSQPFLPESPDSIGFRELGRRPPWVLARESRWATASMRTAR